MLRLRHVSKNYGAARAVDRLDLELSPGEVFGLLGPNGAGKTTTLHMVVGLSAPDEGEVELSDLGSPLRANVRRAIGYAPQSLCLYDELTARENVELMAGLYGLSGREKRDAAQGALTTVALADRADQRAGTFSVGMKRRLTLATAIVHRPRLLVLDEPTAGVDPQSRNAIFDNLRSLAASGVTVLYTTHFMEEAELLCDRVAIIDRGTILALGTVAELLAGRGERHDARRGPREADDTRRGGLEALFLDLTGRELRDL